MESIVDPHNVQRWGGGPTSWRGLVPYQHTHPPSFFRAPGSPSSPPPPPPCPPVGWCASCGGWCLEGTQPPLRLFRALFLVPPPPYLGVAQNATAGFTQVLAFPYTKLAILGTVFLSHSHSPLPSPPLPCPPLPSPPLLPLRLRFSVSPAGPAGVDGAVPGGELHRHPRRGAGLPGRFSGGRNGVWTFF